MKNIIREICTKLLTLSSIILFCLLLPYGNSHFQILNVSFSLFSSILKNKNEANVWSQTELYLCIKSFSARKWRKVQKTKMKLKISIMYLTKLLILYAAISENFHIYKPGPILCRSC